jgi:hypothetical protein
MSWIMHSPASRWQVLSTIANEDNAVSRQGLPSSHFILLLAREFEFLLMTRPNGRLNSQSCGPATRSGRFTLPFDGPPATSGWQLP